jgi:hypothetical protein
MDTLQEMESRSDDSIEHGREIIRETLNDIAQEAAIRLQEAGLNIPIFLSVPGNGGKAILTLATPIDPSEGDWSRVSVVVCEVAGKRLDGAKLRGHDIKCAMANATMSVAAVIAD